MNIPSTYSHALRFLGKRANATHKRLPGQATTARKLDTGAIAIRYHATDILTFHPDGRVTVNTGGFRSATTKAKVNDYLPPSFPRLFAGGSVWQWAGGGLFGDGDTFTPRGKIVSALGSPVKQRAEAKRLVALVKRIGKHAALCAASLPLAMPSGGDDWFSALRVTDGANKDKTLGEATSNTAHLESNMTEGYVVPSLVWRALESAGYDPQRHGLVFASVFDPREGARCSWAGDTVKRAMRRYLKARFGLAGGSFGQRKGW